MPKFRPVNPDSPIFCMVLQCFPPFEPAQVIGLTVQTPTEAEATTWFLGWIAGAGVPFIPMRDSLEIFRYEGKGNITEAQNALEKYIKDTADDMGIDLFEPDSFPGEIRQAIDEILSEELGLQDEGQELSFEGEGRDLSGEDEPAISDVLEQFFNELHQMDKERKERRVVTDDNASYFVVGECSMCGKEAPSQDVNGMCASCRQVWNS